MEHEFLSGLEGSTDPVIDRALARHAQGLDGLDGDGLADLGFFKSISKLLAKAGPIIPIAAAALAPVTGGASLAVGGALTAVAAAGQKAPGAPALPPPASLAPAPLPTSPPPLPRPVAPVSSGFNLGGNAPLLLGIGALALVLLMKGRR